MLFHKSFGAAVSGPVICSGCTLQKSSPTLHWYKEIYYDTGARVSTNFVGTLSLELGQEQTLDEGASSQT